MRYENYSRVLEELSKEQRSVLREDESIKLHEKYVLAGCEGGRHAIGRPGTEVVGRTQKHVA